MPPLSRRSAGALLRTVNGQPHATQADHEDILPTPPPSNSTGSSMAKNQVNGKVDANEDVTREPESSEDEVSTQRSAESVERAFRVSRQAKTRSELPSASSGEFALPSSGTKRDSSSDPDGPIFGSQGQGPIQKRRRTSRPPMSNIHSIQSHAFRQPKNPGSRTYGRNPAHQARQKSDKPSFVKTEIKIRAPKTKVPTFRQAAGADIFSCKKGSASFKPTKTTGSDVGSPDLSSLSDPDSDVEEIDPTNLGLPEPEPYTAIATCTICSAKVPLLLRQGFEDEYTGRDGMSYKFQQWFCNYHRRAEARDVWTARGYPEINWDKLDVRLKRHHRHLNAVLNDRTPSVYREHLQRQVDSGTSKSALSLAISDTAGDTAFSPGYYGPRGEKLCMEHVSSHFAKSLRNLKDPLVVAAGVKGGVSGFVQGVLVPELMVQLVAEDLGITAERARAVLEESTDLGELLCEEKHEATQGHGGESQMIDD